MGNLFTRPVRQAAHWPAVSIIESDQAFVVSAEVPGFTPEQVNVTVHEGVLTLQGEAHVETHEESEGRLVYSERRDRSFKRTFTLNTEVKADAVTAVVKDGLLTVTLPKAESSTPRRVEVKAAS
jgi:HSP20 family protein